MTRARRPILTALPTGVRPHVQRVYRELDAHEGVLASHADAISALRTRADGLEERIGGYSDAGFDPAVIQPLKRELNRLNTQMDHLATVQVIQESTLLSHSNHLEVHDGQLASHNERLETVEVNSTAFATAIARWQQANGIMPLAIAAAAGFMTYLVIEVFRRSTALHIQFAWILAVAGVAGIVASWMSRSDASATASAGATAGAAPAATPAPPADEPAPTTADAALPPTPTLVLPAVPPPTPVGRQAAARASVTV